MRASTRRRIRHGLLVALGWLVALTVIIGFAFLLVRAERNEPSYGEILRTYKVTQTVNGVQVECLSIVYSQGGADEGTKIWCEGEEER